jgi:hypothetical protein
VVLNPDSYPNHLNFNNADCWLPANGSESWGKAQALFSFQKLLWGYPCVARLETAVSVKAQGLVRLNILGSPNSLRLMNFNAFCRGFLSIHHGMASV